jgi:hypothetical protein
VPDYLIQFGAAMAEMDKLQQAASKEYATAKTPKEQEAAMLRIVRLLNEKGRPLGEKALAAARPHAADKEAVVVLTWVINYHATSPAAGEAAGLLARYHIKDPQTLDTAILYMRAPMPWTQKLLDALIAADLPRDRKIRAILASAECARAKAELVGLIKGMDAAQANLLGERFGKEYLAELCSADPAKLEAEAGRRFEEAAREYGAEKYGSSTVATYCKAALFEMHHLAVGKQAPDIEGQDIDGQPFKLSDYRGKVVLLDFWGHW